MENFEKKIVRILKKYLKYFIKIFHFGKLYFNLEEILGNLGKVSRDNFRGI